jgi:hypothetical protein
MNYVAHDCRNSRLSARSKNYCNNRFIAEDITKATTQIPTWRYCPDCCKKLGIDFTKQKPSDYMSEERINHFKNIHKMVKQNIKSE